MSEVVRKLRSFAERCGARIHRVESIPARYAAPFNKEVGIDWRARALLYTSKARYLGQLIHELGHLVLDGQRNTRFRFVGEEYEWLGWEFAVAKKCRILHPWLQAMKGYEIHDDEHPGREPRLWKSLPLTHQLRVLKERLEVAEAKKFLVNGEPVTHWTEAE